MYGWAVSRKLDAALSEFIIENFNEDSDEGYFLEVDVQYLEELHERDND